MKFRFFSLLLILGCLLTARAQFPEDIVDFCATDPAWFEGEDAIGPLLGTTWTLKVLLVEFSDVKHRNPVNHGQPAYTFDDWHNLLFSEGVYVSPNMFCPDGKRVYGSMRDYYAIISDGEFTLTGYVVNRDDDQDGVPDWLTLPNTKEYYANHSSGTFYNASVTAANNAGLDISTPGNATKLVIVYAGNTYRGRSPNGQLQYNGLNPRILAQYTYSMGERYKQGVPYTNEHPEAIFSGIGIHAHEFGHLVGWPDTYGNTWELMNGGLFMPLVGGDEKSATAPMPPNPELRHRKGWINYTPITSDVRFSADYNLKDPEVFQIKDSSNPDRYVLIECRHARGRMYIGDTETWDYNHWAPWNFFNTRQGLPDIWLMVWAMGKYAPVSYARLLQADGFNNATTGYNSYNAQGDTTSFGDSGDIFPGYNDVWVLSPWSFPQALESAHVPSTRPSSNVGMEIVQLYSNYILVDLYYQDPEDASPSQPRFLEVSPSANNHPYLTWYLNDDEPDRTAYEIYKKKNSPNFTLYATVSGNQNYYEDTNEIMLTGPPQANESMVYYRVKAVDSQGKRSTFSNEVNSRIPGSPQEKIASDPISSAHSPVDYALLANYPNPFNPETTIRFTLPEKSNVVLSVYNIAGELMATLVNGEMAKGYHQVNFDASRLASGIYLYRLQAGEFTEVRKMMLLK